MFNISAESITKLLIVPLPFFNYILSILTEMGKTGIDLTVT